MLVHSFTRDHGLSQPAKLDDYTHDPEPLQDPVQIGDAAKVIRGPHRGLFGIYEVENAILEDIILHFSFELNSVDVKTLKFPMCK